MIRRVEALIRQNLAAETAFEVTMLEWRENFARSASPMSSRPSTSARRGGSVPYLPFPPMPEQTFSYCVAQAEQKYQVPSCILQAVHQIESGGTLRPGLVHGNSNGTKDYGVTQINTVWANYF